MDTTIVQILTITALITSTAVQTSVLTTCPSAFVSYTPSASLSGTFSASGVGSSSGAGSNSGPCPGQGYTCDDCLDGWFCPPIQTPAVSAPCGTGWPCYHCDDGWFCVPSPQTIGAMKPQTSSTPSVVVPNIYPATSGYSYVGCYQDTPDRALRDAQLVNLASGMTTDQCIMFCQSQSLAIAGTKSGTQCFCGNTLLDSMTVSNGQCNMTCSGDTTESTVCGGPWALSIWSSHGGTRKGQSLEHSFSLGTTSGSQQTSGLEHTKTQVTSVVNAWPTASPASNLSISSALPGVPEFPIAKLSASASKTLPKEGTVPNDVVGNISSVLNVDISSNAKDVSLANLTSTAFIAAPLSTQLGPGPAIPLTAVPSAATLFVTAMTGGMIDAHTSEVNSIDGNSAGGDGKIAGDGDEVSSSLDGADVDDTNTVPTLSAIMRERTASRRRAHWA